MASQRRLGPKNISTDTEGIACGDLAPLRNGSWQEMGAGATFW